MIQKRTARRLVFRVEERGSEWILLDLKERFCKDFGPGIYGVMGEVGDLI